MRTSLVPLVLTGTMVAIALGSIARLGDAPSARAQSGGRVAYRLAEEWPSAPGPRPVGFVRHPAGVAVAEDGTAYVADAERGQVHVWRGDRFVDVLGAPGSQPGQLRSPQGIAVLDGDVLVADAGNDRVQRFGSDGRHVASWTGFEEPWDVAVTADGLVLVSERGGDRISVLDGDGRRMGSLGRSGLQPGELHEPLGLTAWPDGRMAIVDSGNDRVQVWRLDGTPERVITNTTQLPLVDVAALGDNALLVVSLRRVTTYDAQTWNLRGVSGAPVPGGFSGVAVQPGDAVTPTIYAALNHDFLTGLRRFASPTLNPYEEWLDLPGPPGELVSPRRIAVEANEALLLDAWPRLLSWSTDGVARDQLQLASGSDVEPVGADYLVSTGESVRKQSASAELWSWRPMSDTVWVAGLARSPVDGRVFALDLRGQRVHVLDAEGAVLGDWPLAVPSGGYASYTDLAARPDGRLLLVNRSETRLEVREPADGRLVAAHDVQGIPLRAAPDGEGGAFVLTREGWVWRLGPAGEVRAWWDVAELAPDGRAAAGDLALAPRGRVLVADSGGDRILVFEADPDAVPPEPPQASGCSFTRDKRAAPPRITLGETVGVTLSVTGVCVDQGAETDVMLVLDRSGSMAGAKIDAARSAAVAFVGEMDYAVARVGLVLFNTEATLAMSLTNDAALVVDAVVSAEPPQGGTDIGEGIQVAAEHLAASGRSGVRQVMIVLTDGRPEGHDVDADAASDGARAAGVRVYTIGFGPDVDPDLLARIASGPDDYFFAPGPAELSGIYTEIARRISGGVIARTMVVTDVVPSNMEFLAGSDEPPVTSYADRILRWDLQNVTGAVELSYRLRPLQTGRWPTNVEARSRHTDGLGFPGELVFPVPYVVVVSPPRPVYLPLALKAHCRPREKHADVALVVDTSSSMIGDKLGAAKQAAHAFVALLDLPRDQATIIGFDRSARMATPLTADGARLRAAIDSLAITPGTVIDAGMRMAVDELTSRRANPANNHVLVLLTDGQNNAGREPVLAAADAARSAGITVFTVAFGADADRALMRQVAGDPRRAYLALTPGDLQQIYEQIAGRVGCTP